MRQEGGTLMAVRMRPIGSIAELADQVGKSTAVTWNKMQKAGAPPYLQTSLGPVWDLADGQAWLSYELPRDPANRQVFEWQPAPDGWMGRKDIREASREVVPPKASMPKGGLSHGTIDRLLNPVNGHLARCQIQVVRLANGTLFWPRDRVLALLAEDRGKGGGWRRVA